MSLQPLVSATATRTKKESWERRKDRRRSGAGNIIHANTVNHKGAVSGVRGQQVAVQCGVRDLQRERVRQRSECEDGGKNSKRRLER